MPTYRQYSDAADTSVVLIPDLVPFPFGNTVLCFCADDVPWPPDIELLASIYRDDPPDDAASAASGEAGSRASHAARGPREAPGGLEADVRAPWPDEVERLALAPQLDAPLPWRPDGRGFDAAVIALAQRYGYR